MHKQKTLTTRQLLLKTIGVWIFALCTMLVHGQQQNFLTASGNKLN